MTTESRSTRVKMKRVSFYMPEALFDDLCEFAGDRGETVTSLIRWALGFAGVCWEESKAGNRICVSSDGERVDKEIIISRY
jgi:hypothetical protein